jgi:hypothetical protein
MDTIRQVFDDAARLFGAIQVRRTLNSVTIDFPGAGSEDGQSPIYADSWDDAVIELRRLMETVKAR